MAQPTASCSLNTSLSLKDEIIIEICFYFVPNQMEWEFPKNWDFLVISERLILMGPTWIVRRLALTDAVNEENLSLCKVSIQVMHDFL